MKFQVKWVALVVLFIVTNAYLQAQQYKTFEPKLTLGVGAGPVFTSVDFVTAVPQNTTQGLSGGVSLRYITEKHLGLLAELNYTQRGWTEDFSEAPKNPDHSYSRTLNYIELPLMTHIYFGNKVKFIVNIGLIFFAFTTIIGWNYYGQKCLQYLAGIRIIKLYKIIFIVFVAIGPFLSLDMVFVIADIVNGLMALPNLVGLIVLRKIVIKETEEFFEKEESKFEIA